jgi:hypothetical protein
MRATVSASSGAKIRKELGASGSRLTALAVSGATAFAGGAAAQALAKPAIARTKAMSLLLLVKHFSWLVRVPDRRAHEARVGDGGRHSGAHRVGLRLAVVRCHRLCNKSQSSQTRLGHSGWAIRSVMA